MALFNQLPLRNIFNRQDNKGTHEMLMAVAALAEERKADNLLFLNNNIEALAALPLGWGSLAAELIRECTTRCQYLSLKWEQFLLKKFIFLKEK